MTLINPNHQMLRNLDWQIRSFLWFPTWQNIFSRIESSIDAIIPTKTRLDNSTTAIEMDQTLDFDSFDFPKPVSWFGLFYCFIQQDSSKDGFKGNDSLISWMLAPFGCFLCVKNANKNRWLDKLSQSFSDIFHNCFTWQKNCQNLS